MLFWLESFAAMNGSSDLPRMTSLLHLVVWPFAFHAVIQGFTPVLKPSSSHNSPDSVDQSRIQTGLSSIAVPTSTMRSLSRGVGTSVGRCSSRALVRPETLRSA